MKIADKNLLQIDAVVQATLLIPMLVSYLLFAMGMAPLFFVIAALLQIALAFIQLLSAMAHIILYKNKHRRPYMIVSVIYILFIFLLFSFINDNDYPVLWIVTVSVIPVFIALWYFWLTINDLRQGRYESM